ncbi:hypothetical protein ROS217_01520 [Roseovarius sp. 217]|nr:hypothetical protein ROS217_01520 [Roseovarius sp. 217]
MHIMQQDVKEMKFSQVLFDPMLLKM